MEKRKVPIFIIILILASVAYSFIGSPQSITDKKTPAGFPEIKIYEEYGYFTGDLGNSKIIIALVIERTRSIQTQSEEANEEKLANLEYSFLEDKIIPVMKKYFFEFLKEKPKEMEVARTIYEIRLVSSGTYNDYNAPGIVGEKFEDNFSTDLMHYRTIGKAQRFETAKGLKNTGIQFVIANLLRQDKIPLSRDTISALNME
jgi:hypothetical protein